MEKVIALCKRRGFVFPSSQIYSGLANTYDYGPVGVELKKNIIDAWWEYFVRRRADMVGLDSSVILHPKVWEASGHVAGFADAMVDCKHCKLRTRADHLIEEAAPGINAEGKSEEQLSCLIEEHHIACPNCKKFAWTHVRKFNLLFETHIGIVPDNQSKAYLRGETAQGIFISFKNIVDSARVKLPFGVAQTGKSFRNEITKGNFIFRTLEFELAEIEYFFNPDETKWEKLFELWKQEMWKFVTETLRVREANLRFRLHSDDERSFYSMRTEDLEYQFPFGFKELWGLAYRTDYDLKRHMEYSGHDLSYSDPCAKQKVMRRVIGPAVGIKRLLLAVLCDSYCEDTDRIVLAIPARLAPYKVAVFPLLANKPRLVAKAQEIFNALKTQMTAAWDDRGNVGKRYYSQDEIGTPFCVTVDFDTLENNTVTVRDRDTMKQERVSIHELARHLQSLL